MYPNWLTVEYANTFFMSVCTSATEAANMAVNAPTTATTSIESGAIENRMFDLTTI